MGIDVIDITWLQAASLIAILIHRAAPSPSEEGAVI